MSAVAAYRRGVEAIDQGLFLRSGKAADRRKFQGEFGRIAQKMQHFFKAGS